MPVTPTAKSSCGGCTCHTKILCTVHFPADSFKLRGRLTNISHVAMASPSKCSYTRDAKHIHSSYMNCFRICWCKSRIFCMTSGFMSDAASDVMPLTPACASYALSTAPIVCAKASGVLQQQTNASTKLWTSLCTSCQGCICFTRKAGSEKKQAAVPPGVHYARELLQCLR